MPRITDFNIIETKQQPIIYLSKKINAYNISLFLKEDIPYLVNFVSKTDLAITDIPFFHIVKEDNEMLDVIIGLPIEQELDITLADNLKYAFIPAGKQIITYYQGSYAQLSMLYSEVEDFALKNNLKVIEYPFEYFINDLKLNEDNLYTKVVFSIEEKN